MSHYFQTFYHPNSSRNVVILENSGSKRAFSSCYETIKWAWQIIIELIIFTVYTKKQKIENKIPEWGGWQFTLVHGGV